MGKIQKRAYNSIGRKEKAKLGRSKILESAKTLFAEIGFENTKISDIAQAAGISSPTFYALFKSKLGVLRAIMDECLPHSDHDLLVQQAEREQCPKKSLSIAAKIARRLYDAETKEYTVLQGVSVLSPELKHLEQEREDRRYERLEGVIDTLFSNQLIDSSLSKTKALDLFWAFTGRDMYRLLVIERGWSSDDYESWLAKTLLQILLRHD